MEAICIVMVLVFMIGGVIWLYLSHDEWENIGLSLGGYIFCAVMAVLFAIIGCNLDRDNANQIGRSRMEIPQCRHNIYEVKECAMCEEKFCFVCEYNETTEKDRDGQEYFCRECYERLKRKGYYD